MFLDMRLLMLSCFKFVLIGFIVARAVLAAETGLRIAPRHDEIMLVASSSQPAEFRYVAFPSIVMVNPDEAWIAYKAGRSHATDAGSAIEIVRHTLSSGSTKLI